MSENITFDQIQISERVPGTLIEWNKKLALQNLPTNQQKVLIVGQRLSSSNDDGSLFDVYSNVDVAERCGYGSIAHHMATAAIKAYKNAALSMITVADNDAATAATGKITIVGTATKSGRVSIKVNDFDALNIAVINQDTAETIATTLAATINAATHLPVSAVATATEVALTAKNKGLAGNAIQFSTSTNVTGLTITTGSMRDGDLNPDIKAALATVAAEGYDIVVIPYNDLDSLLALRDHLDAVSAPDEKKWAIGVVGHTGTLAQAITLTKQLNSEFISMGWYKNTVSLPYMLASAYATVMASEEDPARPLNYLVLDGITPPADKIMRTELRNALNNGVTPMITDSTGTKCQISRAITTYTKSTTGADDESMLDVTTPRTLAYVSKAIDQRIQLRFPREKLNDKTPPKVRSEILDVLIKLEDLEVLEHVQENKEALLVQRDPQNKGMVKAAIPTDVVNGMHVFAAKMNLIL
ncbi:phage tail sheath subtilisin-like domain-containing protein [Neisseria sp. Ec49-e6-T10]|uniref:phage tail sheath subtilisin-like domain-containing protein n=1 Tax=Neisseria sp. Ec49-e6-T10 TaxID=3140744 RepID=UPI003EC004C6